VTSELAQQKATLEILNILS